MIIKYRYWIHFIYVACVGSICLLDLFQLKTSQKNIKIILDLTSNFIFKKYHTVKETLASLMAQIVKNMPAMQETWVKSLN